MWEERAGSVAWVKAIGNQISVIRYQEAAMSAIGVSEAEKIGDKTLRLRSFAALRMTILIGRNLVDEEQQAV